MNYKIHPTNKPAVTAAYIVQDDINGAIFCLTSGEQTLSISVKEIYNYVIEQEKLKSEEKLTNEEAARKSSLDS